MSDFTPIPGQLALLDEPEPLPPHNGTPTSRAAAESVRGTVAKRRRAVLDAIAHLQPCTDHAIAEHLGWDGNSVRPRRGELAADGLIVEDGHAITASGRKAVTWRVV